MESTMGMDAFLAENPEIKEKCLAWSADINAKKYTLHQLVVDIKDLITSQAAEGRKQGMIILSFMLRNSIKKIREEEIRVVCNFFIERITDHHDIVPTAIEGLLIAAETKKLPQGTAVKIVEALKEHFMCQQQQQKDRLRVYKLYKTLFDHRKSELKAMGAGFISAINYTIDCESDPQNLQFLFHWLPEFLMSVELGPLTQETFDAIACYFPVEYKQVSENSNSVSRESLAKALKRCLLANKEFADLTITLAMEKMSSHHPIAKLDGMDLLFASKTSFSSEQYLKHALFIWQALYTEILTNTKDEEFKKKKLFCVTKFVRHLYKDVRSGSERPSNDLEERSNGIVVCMLHRITPDLECDSPDFANAFDIASCICLGSHPASRIVIEVVAKRLIDAFTERTTTPQQRTTILTSLCQFSDILALWGNSIKEYCLFMIPELCYKAIISNDLALKAAGYKTLGYNARLVTPYKDDVFEILREFLHRDVTYAERGYLIDCFKDYAKEFPTELEEFLRPEGVLSTYHPERLELYYEAVAATIEVTQDIYWDYPLETLMDGCWGPKTQFIIALKALVNLLEKDVKLLAQVLSQYHQFAMKFILWFCRHYHDLQGDRDPNVIPNMGIVLCQVIREMSKHEQEAILDLRVVFLNRSAMEIIVGNRRISYRSRGNFAYAISVDGFDYDTPSASIYLLKKFTRLGELVVAIWFGVLFGQEEIEYVGQDFFKDLTLTALETKARDIGELASDLIGSLVNKLRDVDELEDLLVKTRDGIKVYLQGDEHVNNVVRIIAAIAKGLGLRGHRGSKEWLYWLLDLSYTNEAAREQFEDILIYQIDATCHFVIKPLYKQKFIVDFISYIKEKSKPEDENILTIVAHLVQQIPKPVLTVNFKDLIKWILLYLSLSSSNAKIEGLVNTINEFISTETENTIPHFSEILSTYLTLAKGNSDMQIRMLALKGIGCLASYPKHIIVPYQENVLKNLEVCLDDSKRLVRKWAVEVRQEWDLTGPPM